ncbi:MAG: PQQ-like beta-propeller repeat protein [Planctomycetia bacterium]|nr:PQQ-like beta-propeller repeat protein [Planctomycetia bacterium]
MRQMTQILMTMFLTISLFSTVSAADWNQWKGPNRDGKSTETGLNTDWSKQLPKLLWTAEGLGNGFSNLSFFNDKMFTMGDFNEKTYIIALNREDAKLLWKTEIGIGGMPGGYGIGPKCTPTTDGNYVYALSQNGVIACVDFETGKLIWKKDFIKDFNGKMMSQWGFAESPLLDDDWIICCPGSEQNGTMFALDKKTGNVVWKTKELTNPASYASVSVINIDGVRQYLIITDKILAGINCQDGSLLWKVDFPGRVAVCTDPVYDDHIVFVTCAYGVGSYAYSIKKQGNQFVAKEIYNVREVDNKHHGLILDNGFIYSTTDKGALSCVEMKNGKMKWQNRRLRAVSDLAFADGHLILRTEKSGELILVEANPEKYVEKGRFQQPDRTDQNAWTYPLILDGKLFIRDQDKLFCYDLSK